MIEPVVTVTDELDVPVKDDFTGDIAGSIALGSANRIKIKGSDSIVREVANIEGTAVITTIEGIKSLTGNIPSKIFYTTNPGKEGFWVYVDDDSTSDDDGITVLVSTDDKRFFRILGDTLPITLISGEQDTITSAELKSIISLSNETGLKISVNVEIAGLPDNFDILNHQVVGTGEITYKSATIYKEENPIFGVPHNIDEEVATGQNDFITGGIILPAPTAEPLPSKGIDILAHWYNDFGLNRTIRSATSYKGWYDWRWNHTNAASTPGLTAYDPQRHPLLGWYRGDDANVLDWQCYWLTKYGVTGVIITNNVTEDTFTAANTSGSNSNMHWVWQLFNNAPNFKNIGYSLWLDVQSGVTTMNTNQLWLINSIYGVYKNPNIYRHNGKNYPIFFIWDMEAWRGKYDNFNGSTNSRARLRLLTDAVKALGYDGMCIIGRFLSVSDLTYSEAQLTALADYGCIVLDGAYQNVYSGNPTYTSYTTYADTMNFPVNKRLVLNLMTACESKPPHPSGYGIKNSTPQAFARLINRAVDHLEKNKLPKVLTIYNMSEWAEAGPGLQPNQKDAFCYLEAVSSIQSLSPDNLDLSELDKVALKANLAGGNTYSGAQVLDGANLVSVGIPDAQIIKNPCYFRTVGSATTGAIVIKHNALAASTGFQVILKLFRFDSARLEEITLRFEQPTSSTVTAHVAYLISATRESLNVLKSLRVGFDGAGQLSVVLNEVTTVWGQLSHVVVEEIITISSAGGNTSWRTGWAAAIETDLSAYTALANVPIVYTINSKSILSASASLDFPSVASNQNATLTIPVPGAAVGDAVSLGLPNSLIPPATWNGNFMAWVSAADTVSIRFNNNDPAAAHDLAPATFTVKVFK